MNTFFYHISDLTDASLKNADWTWRDWISSLDHIEERLDELDFPPWQDIMIQQKKLDGTFIWAIWTR